MSFGRMGSYAASAAICAALGCVAMAQEPPSVKAFHPAGPLPSYEVATIKPANPVLSPTGRAIRIASTLRGYIAMAYGVQMPPNAAPGCAGCQVIGGPAWVDQDRYEIDGKPPDALRDAMQKMSKKERQQQTQMLAQSLLAERFHLKVHFETRELPVLELVPAKGGLKITAVDPPPPHDPAQPMKLPKPGEPEPPGMTGFSIRPDGSVVIQAGATTMEGFAGGLRAFSPEMAERPVIDMTGFKGNFDVKEFRFLGPQRGGAAATAEAPTDAEPVDVALEQQLGIKLVRARGPVEVVVIDSIDRPTEN